MFQMKLHKWFRLILMNHFKYYSCTLHPKRNSPKQSTTWNPKTSAGLDEMSSSVVKYCEEKLIVPQKHIVSLSFQSGEFSTTQDLKTLPLLKKGKSSAVENYGRISLVSTFSKIVERWEDG